MNIFKQTYIHIFLYAINVLRTCVYIHTDNENGRRDTLVRMRVILQFFFQVVSGCQADNYWGELINHSFKQKYHQHDVGFELLISCLFSVALIFSTSLIPCRDSTFTFQSCDCSFPISNLHCLLLDSILGTKWIFSPWFPTSSFLIMYHNLYSSLQDSNYIMIFFLQCISLSELQKLPNTYFRCSGMHQKW